MVGESRVQLSGGQAGKIRDWPYPEHVVHEALDGLWLTEPLGWWVVAHRLSTIKNAYVIDLVKNCIVEKGKHESA